MNYRHDPILLLFSSKSEKKINKRPDNQHKNFAVSVKGTDSGKDVHSTGEQTVTSAQDCHYGCISSVTLHFITFAKLRFMNNRINKLQVLKL